MGTEAGGKEVQATGATVKLNQMSGGPGPSQQQGPLLAGAGADAAGGQSGGDAEDDEAKKRAAPASGAKKPGKSSGPSPDECTAPGHPVDAVTGCVIDDAVELLLPGAFPLEWTRWYSTARRGEKGALGRGGWKHGYEQWLEVEERCITYRNADGRDIWLEPVAVGGTTFHRRERLTLTRSRHGFELYAHDEGLTYELRPLVPGGRAWLVAVRDSYGHRAALDYDGERLVRVTDTAGRELRLAHTPEGFIRRVEVWAAPPLPPSEPGVTPAAPQAPRLCQWLDYAYHATEELATATDALGHADRFAYDTWHRMVQTTLKNGTSFHYRYDDASGRCVKTWGDGGLHEVDLAFDLPNKTTTITATNEPRVFLWEDHGLVVEERTLDGAVKRRIERDADLYVLSESNAAGETTRSEYDAAGHLTKEVDAAGNETVWEWSGDVVLRRTGPDGLVTSFVHDGHGAPVAVQYPTGAVYQLSRDGEGRVVELVGPAGPLTSYRHDSHHNLAVEHDAYGGATRYVHDALGRPVARTDALGRRTVVAYDALGQPLRVERPDASATSFQYEPLGNPSTAVDALGQVTRLEWGGTGKLRRLEQPNAQAYAFAYDSDERLVEVRNPRGECYRFEYDAAGRVVREETFDGRVLEYAYDKAERLRRIAYPDDTFRELAYDPLGNLLEDRSPHGSLILARDALGRLLAATVDEPGGPVVVELERDRFGRVVTDTQGGRAIRHEYDAEHRRTVRRLPEGETTRYAYDLFGELAAVEHGGERIDVVRDALGREATRSARRSGVALESRYDALDRLLEQKVTARPAEGEALRRTLVDRTYGYDAAGRVTSIRDARWGTTFYRYDSVGQLIEAERGKHHEIFDYDPAGSLVRALERAESGGPPGAGSEPWQLERGNVLCASDRARYDNDARGRRARKVEHAPDGSALVTEYVWDCRDRLREVRLPDGSLARYRYDAFARRVSKELVPRERTDLARALTAEPEALPAAERTAFLWDDDVLCEERPAGAAPRRVFVHEPSTFLPMLQEEQGRVYTYVLDHLGTPRELVDEHGRVAWSAAYSAWGRVVAVARDPGVRAVDTPFRLLGQYEDAETGLRYTRYRYFEAETGRWLSPDPLGILGGWRLLGFDGDPLSRADPFGLNTALGDQGEALAKQHLSDQGYRIVGSMQNKSGHGVDIVIQDKGTGEVKVVEVKVNGSQMSPDQKKGADWYARDRLRRAERGEGQWASAGGRAKRVAAELRAYLKSIGRKALRGYVLRIEVDKHGRARVVDKKPWKKCK
ncbi:MAG: RHS repeat protein [Myxococcales bacterium]|nr:RHS repeat protein [Myxococcales bacterium]